MDMCTDWELYNIVDNLPNLDRSLWESSRLIAYVVAQVNSKKKLRFKDICSFKWEESDNLEPQIEISNDDIDKLKELSKKWEKRD